MLTDYNSVVLHYIFIVARFYESDVLGCVFMKYIVFPNHFNAL